MLATKEIYAEAELEMWDALSDEALVSFERELER